MYAALKTTSAVADKFAVVVAVKDVAVKRPN
jgi:hypothetical protein